MKGKRVGKYELGKTLGSGSFSKVKLGVNDKGQRFAVKIIDKEQLVREHLEDQLRREISIMKMLSHQHCVQLFDVMQTPNHIYLVLELVTGGELFDRIVAAKRFDEDTGRRFFQQLILGMYYCHSKGVAHRDLKPENLLVDEKDNLKITDFGLANFASAKDDKAPTKPGSMLSTLCGTPNYVAPEVLEEKGYDGLVADIWSCGVILFVMLAGYLPFDDQNLNSLFHKIQRGEYRMASHFSDGAKDLIRKMLSVDPKNRYTLAQVCEHPWFKKGFDRSSIVGFQSGHGNVAPTPQDPPPSEAFGKTAEVQDKKPSDKKKEEIGVGAIGAFEIVSRLTSGVFSSLVTTQPANFKSWTRFIVGSDAKGTMEKLVSVLQGLTAGPKTKAGSTDIKGFINSHKGLLTYVVTITPTVSNELTIVEVKRLRGDTLEYHEFYRQIVAACGADVKSKETIKSTSTPS